MLLSKPQNHYHSNNIVPSKNGSPHPLSCLLSGPGLVCFTGPPQLLSWRTAKGSIDDLLQLLGKVSAEISPWVRAPITSPTEVVSPAAVRIGRKRSFCTSLWQWLGHLIKSMEGESGYHCHQAALFRGWKQRAVDSKKNCAKEIWEDGGAPVFRGYLITGVLLQQDSCEQWMCSPWCHQASSRCRPSERLTEQSTGVETERHKVSESFVTSRRWRAYYKYFGPRGNYKVVERVFPRVCSLSC